jgi:CubicO group peptidase (beta-lactamase class C family)
VFRHTTATRFPIASITKTFTAAAISLLQQDGWLKIQDPLSKHLPAFPRGDEIRLWHLLAHQSGVPDPDSSHVAGRFVAPDELIRMIGARPLLFKAGTETRYSNGGYAVLARVIEEVSGLSYGEFLDRRIFAPLGMTSSAHRSSDAAISQLAEGHVPTVGTALRSSVAQDPSVLFGSGSLFSTASDLDTWLTAVNRNRLVNMKVLPYPFGWGTREWNGRRVLVQSGVVNGYSAVILTVGDEMLNLVVLLNTQSGVTDEGKTLLAIVHGAPVPAPRRRQRPARVSPERLASYAGTYVYPQGEVPMHFAATEGTLSLRWSDSTTALLLTPLSETEFLDRTSFGRVRFTGRSAQWLPLSGEPLECPRRDAM